MLKVKNLAVSVAVLMLLVIAQVVFAANQAPSALANISALENLQKNMASITKDMVNKASNFDKAGSNVTYGKENVGGVMLNVTIYKDKAGNVQKVYLDPNGKVTIIKTISASNGPVLTTTYNTDGSVKSESLFEPIGLKTYTEVNNSDGTKTVTVRDGSLSSNNTLTDQVDANGNIIPGSEMLSTTAGLPAGATYCQNTGQYELAGPSPT